MTKTEIKKLWSLYTSGLAVDTPVEIGLALEDIYDGVVSVEDGQGSYHINDPHREPTQPTVYYKVVRKGRYTYVYFYLYFPWDKNHLHDWTGFMIVLYDGVPIKMVCRSHWDMRITGNLVKQPNVLVSSGDHSLEGLWSWCDLPDGWGGLHKVDYNLVKYTKELSAKVQKIADEANITHETTWGDRKAMVWCRWHWYEYHKLCKEHGAYSPAPWYDFWSRQFPDPSEVYDKYTKLFMKIMEVVYGNLLV